jgi:hypothetical protein
MINASSPISSKFDVEKILEEKNQAKNQTKKVQAFQQKAVKGKPLRVDVREMTSQGLVTMRYSEKVRNVSEVNETVLDVKVRENLEISGNKSILSWNVTRVTDREYDLLLLFAEPSQISNDKVISSLIIFLD